MKRTLLAVAAALMLAGCGGGSKTATMSGGPAGGGGGTPTPTSVAIEGLPTGHTLETGTIPAGQSRTVGEAGGVTTLVRCSGSEDCKVMVAANRAATLTSGSIRVETQTGTLTSGTIEGLPTGHTLETGRILAGQSLIVRKAGGVTTLVRCSGSEDCSIRVAANRAATLASGSLRVETHRALITFLPSTPTPLTPPPPTPITVTTTWEQLPSLVDRMDTREGIGAAHFPGPDCNHNESVARCQAMVKTILAAATEPTGTTRRFQSTINVQLPGGETATQRFWGAWLDNSLFIVGARDILRTEPTSPPVVVYWWYPRATIGIRNRNPVIGVYRGDAVDRFGNWGTSELSYARRNTEGYFDLTINLPALGDRAIMRWSDMPVDDDGGFDNGLTLEDDIIGPDRLKGSFYQGGEVGGVFRYRWRRQSSPEDNTLGAFGAKLTPDSP